MDANDIFESLITTEGRSDPYPLYAALHRLGRAAVPVTGAVIVHGYDAIDAVLRDPAFLVADADRFDTGDDGTGHGDAGHGGEAVLSAAELLDNLTLLLVAGFETTTNLLGNGLRVILQQPGLGTAVRDGSVPVPAFVEEVLRYDSPVQLTSRRRADPAEVGGVPVPGGTDVITLLGAGNRDPRRFAAPDTFDPLRPDGATLSFGAGAHFCLGAALARLEGAIAFPRLLRRFPRLAAAGEPERRPGLVLRGFETLPITLT